MTADSHFLMPSPARLLAALVAAVMLLATYSLQRQKDKAWRITGCLVVRNKGRIA